MEYSQVQASFNSDAEMEESRRLCYVGITRAKETLFMTSAEVRRVFGRTVAYPQSDFISEIKPELKRICIYDWRNKRLNSGCS